MTTKPSALTALRDLLKNLSPPNVDGLGGRGYVYPDEYVASLSTTGALTTPVLIVAETVGRDSQVRQIAAGCYYDSWEAEVLLLLSFGEVKYPNALSATSELQQRNWVQAVKDSLLEDLSLGGTVANIGQGDSFFSYLVDHFQWNQKPYWGIRFGIPVMQEL